MKKYELGRILTFNKNRWGFIKYSKNSLFVMSESSGITATFKINKSDFDRIYNKSVEGVVSEKTIKYAKEYESRKKELLKKLKRGVIFVALDEKEYTCTGVSNEKILFYNEEGSFSAEIDFVVDVLDKFNDDYINHIGLVKTKKDYNSLSLKEKIFTAINYAKSCYDDEGTEMEILDVGNILEGEAFYHEKDACYKLIGLEIKFRYKYDFLNDFKTTTGFFPIYIGKIPGYYPVSFEEGTIDNSFGSDLYTNGCGDEIEYFTKLIDEKKVRDCFNN